MNESLNDAGRLSGRVAIVTGAASAAGLGFATVEAFVREGAAVVMTDISPDVKDRLADLPGTAQVEAVEHDVRDEASWVEVFTRARAAFGFVDILVNNAGLTRHDPIDVMDFAKFELVIATNLGGAWLGCKHAVAEMRRSAKGGSIVNIASISGAVGIRHSSPYGSSKGGIRSLTKVVALETARDNIRCNAVCPGLIMSDIHAHVQQQNPQGHKKQTDNIPMGRMGDPSDIAEAALYLASNSAAYVTGTEIYVDGGYTAQ